MSIVTVPRYATFTCKRCEQSDEEGCGDACAIPWVDELPPNWLDEFWPACKCCGAEAHLMTPLMVV